MESSYFWSEEIEISKKKDVLETCKWLVFIQNHHYYRTQVPRCTKNERNFNVKLSEVESRKRTFSSHSRKSREEKFFFSLSKVKKRNFSSHSQESRVEREMRTFNFNIEICWFFHHHSIRELAFSHIDSDTFSVICNEKGSASAGVEVGDWTFITSFQSQTSKGWAIWTLVLSLRYLGVGDNQNSPTPFNKGPLWSLFC